jgi:hypothetical protein
MRRLFVVIALSAALGLPVLASTGRDGMTVSFTDTAVNASGVTPGATIVFHGTARLRIGYGTVVRRFTKAVTDDDRDGVVTYDIEHAIPPNSLWIVADSANGEVLTASPARQLEVAQDPRLSFRNGDEPRDRFSCSCLSVEMLYVVPGRGVWLVHAVDGTPSDHDPREGVTSALLADAVPLLPANAGNPHEFAPGATLVAVDLNRREVFTRRMTDADFGGVR